MAFEIQEIDNSGTIIKVVGVGGAGGNAITHMIANEVSGVEFIAANTDAQVLSRSNANVQIQLGGTGLGAGANPERGEIPVIRRPRVRTRRNANEDARLRASSLGRVRDTGE